MNQTRDVYNDPVMGPYHVHRCERCGVGVPCFSGPTCDLDGTDGYCSQSCYNHETRAGSRLGQIMSVNER
jgi:hypothetical protein